MADLSWLLTNTWAPLGKEVATKIPVGRNSLFAKLGR